MSSEALDTAILDNWSDLDAAASQAQRIEDRVCGELNSVARHWAAQRDWSGVYDFPEGAFWLAAPKWTTSKGKRPNADVFFQLEAVEDENDHYYLSSLTGLGRGKIVFRLYQSRIRTLDWKALIADPRRVAELPDLLLTNAPAFELPDAARLRVGQAGHTWRRLSCASQAVRLSTGPARRG